ncbi:MAG TPA: hypothetical protein VE604_04395 [Candidatus Polarisedimenticolia bacterium]|jgi:hypothetical protein|nr:hypothetical protein [Candidatus Polarisedimenticolia bacterium]
MRPFWSLFQSPNNFKRVGALFALALASVAALAISSEPWKDKEYKSWTQDEVQKILYESPWVKMVEVSAPWLKGRLQYLTPLPADCDGRPDMNRGDRTPTSWQLGGNESIVIYQVTWQSARTVRAAKLRESILCGRGNAERGEEMLEEQPDHYIITIHSPDMTPFKGVDEDGLAKASTLWAKKTSKKISPESVIIGRYGNNNGAPYMLTFKFPRRSDNGEPTIANDEKEVEFASQIGKFSLKAKFQMQKMTVKGGPDL